MFLNKRTGEKSEAPRTEIQEIAATHGGTSQKILAVMVGLTATAIILGTVGWVYVRPILSNPKPGEPVPADKTAKPVTAQISVPLDIEPAASDTAPAADPYKQLPGLAGDQRPSAAPPRQYGATAADQRIGAPPPGMPAAGAGTGPAYAPQAGQDPISDRKLRGDLGEFGDTPQSPEPAKAAQPQARAVAIGGEPCVEEECTRRGAGQGPMPARAQGAPGQGAQQSGPAAFAAQLQPIATPNGSVGMITNPHLTLRKGEPITCTLSTAIQSDQAGFVECVTDFPIFSMDGKVILAERGTRIVGEYSRDVAPGSRNIFVLWTRGETPAPAHVTFDLLSPGSDRLGRSGISGDVDNKYWERYSGALMFSLLQDVSTAAAARAAGTPTQGSNVFVLPSTQSAGQTAVAELLKQGSDVKRSLYRNHGDTISITVARYIDFSPVYKLRSVKGGR